MSGCSTADTAEGSAVSETPASQSPGADPSESALPVAAPDPGAAVLVVQTNSRNGGVRAVRGLKTEAEAVTLQAACAQTGTMTIELARVGPMELSCGPDANNHSLTVDIRPAAGVLDVDVHGTEGVPWGVTITEAELP
ncbi:MULTISPECIES: hypothetical protein [unclassified Arthrobacter]|uniref:hypothetical protein n=1 Tax=unclassified Arthrobacter TaxID=235627 RepID=UPI0021035A34|nr:MULTISPECIES: hypothetical protein [unclassified Arthrobacter]MCQ1986607.1 hypothetical protein [Arthrobacter sp. zg-Y844]MCQ1995268.1 hypothetical protein [Arthrobacter sp. zg-Y1171]UWX80692.1 hypothetical protein N2L00_09600 [Arthrobacter sp. zg-Y1171]